MQPRARLPPVRWPGAAGWTGRDCRRRRRPPGTAAHRRPRPGSGPPPGESLCGGAGVPDSSPAILSERAEWANLVTCFRWGLRIPLAPQPRSSGPPVQPPMETRQSELIRVLQSLAAELPNPDWVALVDGNGLIMAGIPDQPVVGEDRISAMAAASMIMADRVLEEIEGGRLRFASIAGARRQLLTVALGAERLLW